MKIRWMGAALALCCSGANAGADKIAPARYVDAQGVEVIHDRGSSAPPREDAAGAPGREAAPAPADPRLAIRPAEQARRDEDRIAILEQELKEESRAYADLLGQAAGAARARPEPAQAARLNEQLVAHQKNIQALNQELRRARDMRGAAGRRGTR
jgi:hypothetical protein